MQPLAADDAYSGGQDQENHLPWMLSTKKAIVPEYFSQETHTALLLLLTVFLDRLRSRSVSGESTVLINLQM